MDGPHFFQGGRTGFKSQKYQTFRNVNSVYYWFTGEKLADRISPCKITKCMKRDGEILSHLFLQQRLSMCRLRSKTS